MATRELLCIRLNRIARRASRVKATRTAPTRLRFHRIFTHRREESPANYWFPVRGETAWERGECWPIVCVCVSVATLASVTSPLKAQVRYQQKLWQLLAYHTIFTYLMLIIKAGNWCQQVTSAVRGRTSSVASASANLSKWQKTQTELYSHYVLWPLNDVTVRCIILPI